MLFERNFPFLEGFHLKILLFLISLKIVKLRGKQPKLQKRNKKFIVEKKVRNLTNLIYPLTWINWKRLGFLAQIIG
jgi:hypothetical protein